MTQITHIDSGFRFTHLLVSLAAGLSLAACSDSGNTASSQGGAASQYETADDHAIGNPDASVTVVEYASVVCGACANWHETVYPDFKTTYIDSGKVRYVFREFPTSPANLARTGFLIANCADETKFFENIALQFKRQRQIFKAAGNGTVREEYINIAKSAGLNEEEFYACLSDEAENARYDAVVQGGEDAGVTGTPSFFINGEKISRTPSGTQLFTMESFAEVLGPLLGEESAAEPEADDSSAPEAP